MASFQLTWDTIPLNTTIKVSDGNPPPSTNKEGNPYKIWKSHNFIGTLEDKIDREGWRYLKFQVNNEFTPNPVDYLAYEVAETINHNYELVE